MFVDVNGHDDGRQQEISIQRLIGASLNAILWLQKYGTGEVLRCTVRLMAVGGATAPSVSVTHVETGQQNLANFFDFFDFFAPCPSYRPNHTQDSRALFALIAPLLVLPPVHWKSFISRKLAKAQRELRSSRPIQFLAPWRLCVRSCSQHGQTKLALSLLPCLRP